MADHPVPKTRIETLKEIIEGYYEAGTVGELVEDEDVSEETTVSTDVVRRQKKFLADIGALDKDGYDYTLLEPGHRIGRALAYDRDSDAAQAMEGLLSDWDVTEHLKQDLGEETQTKEEIIESLAYLTETDKSQRRNNTGLSALVDIYAWTGILSGIEGEGYHLSIDTKGDTNPPSKTEENDEVTKENSAPRADSVPQRELIQTTQRRGSAGFEMEGFSASVSIDIELSGDEDPENVRNLLVAIREELNQDEEVASDVDSTRDSDGHQPLGSFED